MNTHLLFTVIGAFITALSYGVALLCGVDITPNWLEAAAVSISYTCTILFMLQKRIAYFYGVLSTALLCAFFLTQGLAALAIFNGVLTLSLIYGYYRWGDDKNSIPVTRINAKGWAGYISFFIIIVVAFLAIVGYASPMDVFLASVSATAQLMLDNKKIENWCLWILVNVLSIVFFWQQGFILMAIQFTLFLANAIIALIRWNKDIKVAA